VAGRHDWQTWDAYQETHYSNLEAFPTFILDDRLSIEIGPVSVIWDGVLVLAGNVELSVEKVQDVMTRRDGRKAVRTRRYAYHATVAVDGRKRGILRYDNHHSHPRHPDAHHRHVRDAAGAARVEYVGAGNWPTLGEVIKELEGWLTSGEVERLRALLRTRPLALGEPDELD